MQNNITDINQARKIWPEQELKQAKNLKGMTFGDWTPLYRTTNSGRCTRWVCKCKCGTIKPVIATNLMSGKTTSCGCTQIQKIKQALTKDLSGQVFGHLTVIEQNGYDNDNHITYKCRCDCGNIVTIRGSSLTSGNTKSCGKCDTRHILRFESFRTALIGKKFGLLTVESALDYDANHKGRVLWNCKCDCGNTKIVSTTDLTTGSVRSCGCLKSSYGEKIIKELLEKENIKYIYQYTTESCKDIRKLPFDFAVINNDIVEYIIEFDGEQHLRPTGFYGGVKKFFITQEHDNIKNQWCKKNNIPLIRIPYAHLNNLCLKDLQLETTQFRVV